MGFSLLFRRGFEAALENRSSAAISAAGFFDEGRVRSEVSGHETRCAKRGHTRLFEYSLFGSLHIANSVFLVYNPTIK